MDAGMAQAALFDLILQGKSEMADSLLAEFSSVQGYHATVESVLEPTLVLIGERWSKEQLSLAQGYIAGKVAEKFLLTIDKKDPHGSGSPFPLVPPPGKVIIGNIEDDYHALGRRLVGIFLKAAGWQVEDLGNDVTAVEFVDAAERSGARVIGVSAMMHTNALNIIRVREELDRRSLTGSIMLAVGGAVFRSRPELAAMVGGDGTAENGFQVPALMLELQTRALSGGAQ